MPYVSTIGNVYEYHGSLVQLQTGGLIDISLVNFGSGALSATFIDDDGILASDDAGITTVSVGGGPAHPVWPVGTGWSAVAFLLTIPLFPKPVMAFIADGRTWLHFPEGTPVLSGLVIAFDIEPGSSFNLPNPVWLCLAQGTLIDTPMGEVPVEELRVGDLVTTLDHGPQPLRWVGGSRLSLAAQIADPRRICVTIPQDALGPGLPKRDLRVTQPHRMLLQSVVHGLPLESLAPGRLLVGRQGITLSEAEEVTCHHLMFDRHEIIFAEGCATESLHPSALQGLGLAPEEQERLGRIFPEVITPEAARQPVARPVLTRRNLRDLDRLHEGRVPLYGRGLRRARLRLSA